jgi:acetyltransferase EpsM
VTDRPIILLGAGNQGRVALDLLRDIEVPVAGFLDDTRAPGDRVGGQPILGPFADALTPRLRNGHQFLLTFGAMEKRLEWGRALLQSGAVLYRLVHPSSLVGDGVRLGEGVFVSAQCALFAGAEIGDFSMINNHCSIGHDCRVGAANLFGPAVHLAGTIATGQCCKFGTGALVQPDLTIGERVRVAGGALVHEPVEDGMTVIGNPGRSLRLPDR